MRGRSGRLLLAALAVAAALGVAFRVWVSASKLGTLDSDEAVWGLMALRTAHGHPSVFYWGQNYGGALETYLLAPVFLVTGLSIPALRVFQTVLYAVAALLVWRIGRRTIGEPGAQVAAVVFWIWPAYLVWRSTREYGFYGSALVLSLSSLLLVLRLYERRTLRDLALLGLTLGLGWWATPMCAFVSVPASLWLAFRRPRLLRDLPLVVGAAVLGALPWLVWNLRHNWLSFHAAPAGNTYASRLKEFFASTFPTLLGLRVPFSLEWLTGSLLGRVLTAAVVVFVLWLALRRRTHRLEPLLAIAFAAPFLYATSPYAWIVNEPRYLTVFAPIVALLLAVPLARAPLAVAALAAAAALTTAALVDLERHDLTAVTERGRPVPTDISPLLDTLRRAGATRAVAPYWIAYRLTFESGRRVVATASDHVRSLEDDRLVRSSRHPAYVFASGQAAEAQARRGLLRRGYRRVARGGWTIYVWLRAAPRRGTS